MTRRHSKVDRMTTLLDVSCSKSKQDVIATTMARTVIISVTRHDSNWNRKPSTRLCRNSRPVQAVHGHIIAARQVPTKCMMKWRGAVDAGTVNAGGSLFSSFAFGILALLNGLHHTLISLTTHSSRNITSRASNLQARTFQGQLQ